MTIPYIDAVLGDHSRDVKDRILSSVSKLSKNTANLLNKLNVAVGLWYDITLNISVEDGVVNGAPCVVKCLQYLDSQSVIPSIIWVQFNDEEAGTITRQNYKRFYNVVSIDKKLTPIFACKRTFKVMLL